MPPASSFARSWMARLKPVRIQVTWNGMDDAGRAVASGVYLYRLSTPDNQMVRRMVLVR